MLELCELAEDSLLELTDAAAADADPDEVMPPMSEPGWTPRRRAAFAEFHRSRSLHANVETTYVIRLDGRVVGAARLEPLDDGAVEAGVWLGRSVRGAGLGRVVLTELVALARRSGAVRLVAATTAGNHAARGILTDFAVERRGDDIAASLELR